MAQLLSAINETQNELTGNDLEMIRLVFIASPFAL